MRDQQTLSSRCYVIIRNHGGSRGKTRNGIRNAPSGDTRAIYDLLNRFSYTYIHIYAYLETNKNFSTRDLPLPIYRAESLCIIYLPTYCRQIIYTDGGGGAGAC